MRYKSALLLTKRLELIVLSSGQAVYLDLHALSGHHADAWIFEHCGTTDAAMNVFSLTWTCFPAAVKEQRRLLKPAKISVIVKGLCSL